MDETKIKESFAKAKQDIKELKDHFNLLEQETHFLRQTLDDILYHQQFQQIFQQKDRQTDQQTDTKAQQTPPIPQNPAQNLQIPTQEQETPARQYNESSTPAQNNPFKALKEPFSSISNGNEGVPADRQTDRQTDQQTQNQGKIGFKTLQEHTFRHISEAIDTLDQAKKGIRLQFKRLTKQEMDIFAAIFTLEDQGFIVDYPLLAQKCSLTESSIRDYLQKLLKKGAPILKTKENNKKILLKIAPELRKIVSLPIIHHLREL